MPKDFDLLDMDYVNTASTTDCTGLIPAAPVSKAEMEAYEELYPYLPSAVTEEKMMNVRSLFARWYCDQTVWGTSGNKVCI